MNLREAARVYFERGWTCIPLQADAEGRPKRPIDTGWPATPHDWTVIEALGWERAKGLGIVLGPVSGNLGVIDIDDVALAERILALCNASPVVHRFVRTGRNRGHLYLTERTATAPRTMRIDYEGRSVSIELKGQGQQVAAPPTPGYSLINGSTPVEVPTLAEAWASIATRLGLPAPTHGTSGYPASWQENVPEGERNNALFVESCRLREAGMPLRVAIATMLARAKVAYAGAVNERELTRTVQSAYRRGSAKRLGGIQV